MTHRERVQLGEQAVGRNRLSVKERYRLSYHFMPAAGWMNDPNGLIFFNGEYHVFYQHYPYEPRWGPMHWGHAKSADLLRWEHLPIALAPSEEYDLGESGGYGCFSGSAVDDDGRLTLIYTGHVDGREPPEAQCLAVSSDGISFDKIADNPVISCPPDANRFGFRDPKVWRHGGSWFMVVGYGKDGVGQVLVYQSPDLRSWRYLGAAAESDGTMGDMWECPDLFPLGEGDNHVLICSPMNMGSTRTMYLAGCFDYDRGRLDVRKRERLDYGHDFYAPQTMLDDRGRRILLGWMNIWGASMPEQEDGWMGAFTIARELTIASDGALRMNPVEEMKNLRRQRHVLGQRHIPADSLLNLDELGGTALELIAEFEAPPGQRAEFGLQVRCSLDSKEYTEIVYFTDRHAIAMDCTQSGAGDAKVSEAPLDLLSGNRVKLHLFIDRSSAELFANDGCKTITNRIYPHIDSTGIRVFARHSSANLLSLEVWEIQ